MVRTRLLIVAGVMVASLGWVAAQAPVVPRVSPQKLRMQPEDAPSSAIGQRDGPAEPARGSGN